MPKIFEQASAKKPKYSGFDLSHERKLSLKSGSLIPIYMDEIVPGDQFRVKTELMLRMAPMVAPVMHRFNVYVHYFFTPSRLLWTSWEDFITGGPEGTTTPAMPTIPSVAATWGIGSLPDYMGLPIPDDDTYPYQVSKLPFRAYQLIWNDYYRNQNMTDAIDIHTMSNADLITLRNRCWEKDYFTSCLPFAQRGPEVRIPMNDPDEAYLSTSEIWRNNELDETNQPLDSEGGYLYGNSPNLQMRNIDMNNLGGTINQLRIASKLQEWYELAARTGARYTELLLGFFGQRNGDARLNRPEYLGGGKQPIVFSEVLNTSATATEPQGNMSGHGISVGSTNTFQKHFTEHGYVIGIMSVLPRSGYGAGIQRLWNRSIKEDYYWPQFANLGEQAVLNKELWFDTSQLEANEETFGYQQRYAEYKYGQSSVHGEFRTTLDHWHCNRLFDSSIPALNESFVTMTDADIDRIFAVADEEQFYCQVYNSVKARRPMPYFSNPRL